MGLYAQTLEEIKAIPAGVPYREQVEKFTNYRLKVVQDNEDVRGGCVYKLHCAPNSEDPNPLHPPPPFLPLPRRRSPPSKRK